ncbi:MAG TPA: ABC transporter substrate-binding protein [Chloroflexota bacterium]|nr:ABC transporter substrate-binding protein [Chloroflexota bacterium]
MRAVRFIATICVVVTTVGCGGSRAGAPAGASASGGGSPVAAEPGPSKVGVGVVGSASDAGLFIAEEKGYFAQQKIEVETTRFSTAADMVAPLGRGQLDVGAGAPSAGLLNAIARDIPLKIVADKGNVNPGFGFQAIMIRKDLWDAGVRGPADLRGRTVAINARDITPEVLLDHYLRSGGLTINDVNVVTLGFADMFSGFANGSVDAAFPIEPFVTQIVESGTAVIAVRADAVLPGQQVAVILYGPNFAQNTDLARRFMVAYIQGVRDYNDAFAKNDPAKKADVSDILARNTPVKDLSLYDKMVMPGLNPNGRVNLDSLNDSQNWWIEKGSQGARADLSKVVDDQYVDYAVKLLGAY